MGLFGRDARIAVSVAPVDALPGTDLRADVTTERTIDEVTSATADWGYRNFYRYRRTQTSDKDTEDWVSVQRVDLPVSDDRFDGATATFRVPSWAPGSSADLARWECRVEVTRSGRDAESAAVFTVRIPAPASVESPLVRTDGDATTIDLVLSRLAWRAGAPITGHVAIIVGRDLPPADIAVQLVRERVSHPLTRTPAAISETSLDRVQLDSKRVLKLGMTLLPFEIPTDPAMGPNGDTVHTTLDWYVQARVMYKGFSVGMERVRRRIVVYNA